MDIEASALPAIHPLPAAGAPPADGAEPFDRERYLRQLQALHGLRDELGLAEGDFRDLLERISGSRSARWLTPSQRERAVALLRLHREFDALAERVEAARDALAEGLATAAAEVLPKRIRLDGRELARLRASVEEVLALVRFHHPGATLVGAREAARGGVAELVLEFRGAAGADAESEALSDAA